MPPQRYLREGIENRFYGDWDGFALATTPEQVVGRYRALADADMQYFFVETLDAADEESMRLLAEQVVRRIHR